VKFGGPSPRTSRSRIMASESPRVAPVFPLLVLRTLRDLDRPEEYLEGEDVASSLPRRLGLSEVVRMQIQKYEAETKAGRLQPSREVEDLLRLMNRRPDAAEIFHLAGRRVAQHAWGERNGTLRGTVRFLPQPLARLVAHRAARRLLHRLAGEGGLRLRRWPVELTITDSITARADPEGAACAFYAGVLEELLRNYTGRSYRAHHASCAGRGDDACEWHLRLTS
jgi:bacteriochlorophyll 4-vinyl reductase